jgi:hypothetical protein
VEHGLADHAHIVARTQALLSSPEKSAKPGWPTIRKAAGLTSAGYHWSLRSRIAELKKLST